jgi:hypothetical protein
MILSCDCYQCTLRINFLSALPVIRYQRCVTEQQLWTPNDFLMRCTKPFEECQDRASYFLIAIF